MYLHALVSPFLSGVQLPLTHLTLDTLRPELVQIWSVNLPVRLAGSHETLHHAEAGAAVVGALVGAATPLPVAVQSTVIHPLFCKGQRMQSLLPVISN